MNILKLGLVPTVLILIFMIKVVNGQFDDPDYYWHVKTGEYIVAHGMLPHGDIFSYTNLGKPWVLHEWLFQVLIYLVQASFGNIGVKIFVALCLTACFWLCYAVCEKILNGDKAKALIVALLYCSIITGVAPRPHLFTFLFLSLFLYILLDFKYFGITSRLWLIPVVMVLWANIHGGFFIGLVTLWLFIVGEWLEHFSAGKTGLKKRKHLMWLTATGIAALCATLLNPQFFHLWLYPFQVIGMDASHGIIEEWRSPDFQEPVFKYWLVVVFSFIAVMIYSPRRPDVTEFLVPLFFVGGSFVARRNIPLAALAMAPFVAVHMQAGLMEKLKRLVERFRQVLTKHRTGVQSNADQSLGRYEFLMNWLLVLVTAIALIAIYPQRQTVISDSLNRIIPVKATDFIVREGIKGRMFNAYHYGGYLIYRLYPQQLVFIDGRADMYGDAFIKQALAIYQGSSQWKSLFDRYAIDYVICESEAPIRQLLLAEGKFHLVFDDGMHSVLLRDIPRFHSIIERFKDKPAND